MPARRMTRLAVAAATAAVMLTAPAVGHAAKKRAPAKCRVAAKATCAGAKLKGAKLAGRNLAGADLRKANLTRAKLGKAKLGKAKLAGANLTGANLAGATLTQADLTRANLDGTLLAGADMTGAKLQRATLRGAKMAGVRFGTPPSQPAIALDPGKLSNCRSFQFCNGDLRYANLSGADLTDAMFYKVTLGGASLARTNLTDTFFYEAELITVDFRGATLQDAIFYRADLRGANLSGVDLTSTDFLSGVDLRGANLNGANLSGVNLRGVTMTAADLAGAKIDGARLPANVLDSVPQTKVTGFEAFTATFTNGGAKVTCTAAAECAATVTYNSQWTLTVTTPSKAFLLCPDGFVRMTAAPGGGYTGTCTYRVFQGITVRVLRTRSLTVRATALNGDPEVSPKVSMQWRAAPTYDLVEPEHVCTNFGVCTGEFPEGASVKLVYTGVAPFFTAAANGCAGGLPTGDNVMVTDPPGEITCLVDASGNPVALTADREVVFVRS